MDLSAKALAIDQMKNPSDQIRIADVQDGQIVGKSDHINNLDQKIVQEIAEKLGMTFVPDEDSVIAGPDPRTFEKARGPKIGSSRIMAGM